MKNRGSTLIITNLVGVHQRTIHTKFEANPCSGLREEVEKPRVHADNNNDDDNNNNDNNDGNKVIARVTLTRWLWRIKVLSGTVVVTHLFVKIKVASATVVVTLTLHINTNKIDHVLNVYIFYEEGYSWINPICEVSFWLATTIIAS